MKSILVTKLSVVLGLCAGATVVKVHPQDDGNQDKILKAAIEDITAKVASPSSHIAPLASQIASYRDLNVASAVRHMETKDFSTSEVELMDVVDTLQRAISILEKEIAQNVASLLKKINMRNLNSVVEVLIAVIDAAAFSSVDRQKLVALVQSRQASDGELSNPAATTYQSHSSDIVDVFNDLLEKAQTTLAVLRQQLRTISRCSSSLLRISWHRITGL